MLIIQIYFFWISYLRVFKNRYYFVTMFLIFPFLNWTMIAKSEHFYHLIFSFCEYFYSFFFLEDIS